MLQGLGSQRVLRIWLLEPSELCAVLVSPLSQVAHVGVSGVAKILGIILRGIDALCLAVLVQILPWIFPELLLNKQITHLSPCTVLNAHRKDVSDVEHEVAVDYLFIGGVEICQKFLKRFLIFLVENFIN